jgi:CheY-like chemotaxis protein
VEATATTFDRSSGAPPAAFVEATKHALEHLYDLALLADHPLAGWLPPRLLGAGGARALRQVLIDAVEQIDPGPHVAASAPERRAFQVLQYRYLEALPYREVMQALALGQSQYHKEQRRAVQALAVWLWDLTRRGEHGPAGRGYADDGAWSEVTAHAEADEVHPAEVLAEVGELLDHLAAAHAVRIRVSAERAPAAVTTSRTALRQALISSAGSLLDDASGGELWLSAVADGRAVQIDAIYRGAPPRPAGGSEKLEVAQKLLRSIGGELSVSREDAAERRVSITVPDRRLVLLVVDDSPDLVQLVVRFVADQPYAVLTAASVEEGFSTAQQARPDVILLDVMMAHKDGWDALQLLRHHPATADIPVIVCTVLGEEQFARSLGAAGFLRKPLTRPKLLEALAATVVAAAARAQPRPAGRPAAPAPPSASR